MTSTIGVFVVYACVILDGLANGAVYLLGDSSSWDIDNFGFAKEHGKERCLGVIEDFIGPKALVGDLNFEFEYFVKMYNYDKGCFECFGNCITFEQVKQFSKSQLSECVRYSRRGIEDSDQEHICQHLANDFNDEGRCEGGEYRCYNTDVHDTINPRWKPICVCGSMSTGMDDCKSVIKTEEKPCDVRISGDDKTCLCRIRTKLIL